MPGLSLDNLFALFGMFLVVLGMAGGRQMKVSVIEVGPMRAGWRVVSIALGLATMTAVGWAVLSREPAPVAPTGWRTMRSGSGGAGGGPEDAEDGERGGVRWRPRNGARGRAGVDAGPERGLARVADRRPGALVELRRRDGSVRLAVEALDQPRP